MRDLITILSKCAAFVVAKVPYIFGSYTLGWKASRQRMSRWYKTNNVYRFPVGAKIRAHKGAFGYGIRAEGVVIAHEKRPDIFGEFEDRYVVEVTKDSKGDWRRGLTEDFVDPDAERVTKTEVHFKWNLENQWRYTTPWYIRLFEGVKSRFSIYRQQEHDNTLRRVHQ